MTLSGRALITGIFGDPVSHSLSPAMHNAAYASLALDRIYVPFRVASARLPAAIRAVSTMGLLGVNLTVPHKESAARLLRNNLSSEARALGAVNTIVNRRGRLFGDNTDARGLELALRELKVSLGDRAVVIIGAGGGAAAAAMACRRIGARKVVIANRTLSRGRRLASRFPKGSIELRGLQALLDPELVGRAALLINATSIGLEGSSFPRLDYQAAAADCLFYDLIYAARPTPFLKPAAERGLRCADGATMLLHQGVLAFKLLNGIEAPAEVMRRALFESLGRPPA